MERLLVIGGLFVVAGLCEIGGYLVWGWVRDHKKDRSQLCFSKVTRWEGLGDRPLVLATLFARLLGAA